MSKKPALAGKPPSSSEVQMTEIVLPSHTNALGTIFGGQIVSWIDIAAAIAATRHCRKTTVTASIDALNFLAPVKLGHVVHLRAQVNYAFRTSMEVGVRVDVEDPLTGVLTQTSSAYTTFVAIDKNGKPTPVPPVLPKTSVEKRRAREAIARREARMALKQVLSKTREASLD